MQTKGNEITLIIIASPLILLFLISFIMTLLFLYQKKYINYIRELEGVKNNYEKNIL